MKISQVDTFVIDVPQRHAIFPYQSRYIATSTTGALLVRLQTESGFVGLGETPQVLSFYGQEPFTAKHSGGTRRSSAERSSRGR